jgi:peptidyl-prolyl cis-trans isomerase D
MQILFSDEAAAKEAETQLAAGKDFAAVAKDIAKTDDPASLDLGWVAREDLPADLAEPVFTLAVGGTSQPIKSTFGWHILRVTEDKPATEQSFDQAKEKLKTEVARDRASDRIADLANQIDDTLAGGAALDTIAQKFGLKTATLTDVDSDGKGPDGNAVEMPKPNDAILHTAFATESSQNSSLTEMGNDGYFLVHVDKVTPATPKPIAEVHDEVVMLWQDEARQAAQQKVADAMIAEVTAGKSLKEVAAAHGLVARTSTALQRNGGDVRVPPTLVAKLFGVKVGEATADTSGDNAAVAQLVSIEPADPTKDARAVQSLTTQVGGTIQNDMVSEFDQGLRDAFPVRLDQANIDRVL